MVGSRALRGRLGQVGCSGLAQRILLLTTMKVRGRKGEGEVVVVVGQRGRDDGRRRRLRWHRLVVVLERLLEVVVIVEVEVQRRMMEGARIDLEIMC